MTTYFSANTNSDLQVYVVVTRVSDGYVWNFAENLYEDPDEGSSGCIYTDRALDLTELDCQPGLYTGATENAPTGEYIATYYWMLSTSPDPSTDIDFVSVKNDDDQDFSDIIALLQVILSNQNTSSNSTQGLTSKQNAMLTELYEIAQRRSG